MVWRQRMRPLERAPMRVAAMARPAVRRLMAAPAGRRMGSASCLRGPALPAATEPAAR